MKVKVWDKKVWTKYLAILGAIGTIVNILLIFKKVPQGKENITFWIMIGGLALIFVGLMIVANNINKVELKINDKRVVIKFGDIFEENGIKVIPVNEYFDMDYKFKIISEKSLHGQFIGKVSNINETCNEIFEELKGKNHVEKKRSAGIAKSYRLGTCIETENDYVLTVASKFDEKDNANLKIEEYLEFLISFWKEINTIYNQRDIAIPLFGSGMVRIDANIDKQKYLELILLSIELSEEKFSYKNKINIVLHSDTYKDINLFKIKSIYK